MKAMLLAAGYGERMRPLTEKTPKPLLPVAGKPLIEYHVQRLASAGFDQLVINVAHLGQQIIEYLGDGHRYGISINYSREGDEPQDTAGGIRDALPLLGVKPFAVINADIWTDYPFAQLREIKLADDSMVHLVLAPNPEHHPDGDFSLDSGGYLELRSDRPRFTFSGIGAYRPDFFLEARPGKLPLRELLLPAIEHKLVSGELYRGVWQDIGTPGRLRQLDASTRKGLHPAPDASTQ